MSDYVRKKCVRFKIPQNIIDKLKNEDEIDIDSIGELKAVTNNIDGTVCIMNKINELVQAVKQINKEVKKLKEDK